MRLADIEIFGLRSISHAKVANCSELNVLIGKNNGGKSSLLTGIDLLFKSLKLGTVASLDSPHDPSVDHHRHLGNDIVVSAEFDVPDELIKSIMTEISHEFPQMRAAVGGLGEFRRLSATVTCSSTSNPIVYISNISLRNEAQECILFSLDLAAAREIAQRARDISRYGDDSEALAAILERSDESMARQLRDKYFPIASIAREVGVTISEAAVSELRRRVERADGPAAVLSALSEYALEVRARSETAKAVELTREFATFAGETKVMPHYISVILSAFDSLKVLYLADRRQPIGPAEASRLLQLKTRRGGGQLLSTIQTTVNSLLGVSIDAFSADSISPQEMARLRRLRERIPIAELDVDEFLVQVNGSGVKEALRLVLDVEFENPNILLLEEPEVHLHPALESAVMRYLRELCPERQIFLTTHSTSFIDAGDVQRVYLVKKDDSTEVELLSVTDLDTRIPRELGLRLSSVFMFDQLVFVEGITDEQILREFSAKLSINLGKANVGFVLMGGSRNYGYYASEATVTLLARRQVRTWFILDRDERDSEGVAELVGKLGEKGRLLVLQRRELENYLLSNRAISRLIAERTGGAHNPTPEEVSALISEIVEELRGLCVAKRVAAQVCRPVIPDRSAFGACNGSNVESIAEEALAGAEESLKKMRESLSSTVASARESVEREWPSNRKSIVPGSELLDEVMKRFGLRYKKERDGVLLAERMEASEIPAELSSLLCEIGSLA